MVILEKSVVSAQSDFVEVKMKLQMQQRDAEKLVAENSVLRAKIEDQKSTAALTQQSYQESKEQQQELIK